MSKLGMADLGIATLNDMRENAGMISSLDKSVPVIADADTGFGGEKLIALTPYVIIRSDYFHRPSDGGPNR
jgi:2-methylisocitrate lyase-like PEP mutase family enzyme